MDDNTEVICPYSDCDFHCSYVEYEFFEEGELETACSRCGRKIIITQRLTPSISTKQAAKLHRS